MSTGQNGVKFFTPREADQTLPLVRRIVEDILLTGDKLRARSAEVGGGAEEDAEVKRYVAVLDELFEELETLGCSYKDWNFTVGLVDFPSIISGQEVFLCWRSDEPALRFFHGVEEGFSGRREIPANYL